MPLPFLAHNKIRKDQPNLIVQHREPDDKESEQDDLTEGLKAVALDLLHAIESKDISRIAEAFKAGFELCDSSPHEEGPHINESEEE